jgi:hypothetical protein
VKEQFCSSAAGGTHMACSLPSFWFCANREYDAGKEKRVEELGPFSQT